MFHFPIDAANQFKNLIGLGVSWPTAEKEASNCTGLFACLKWTLHFLQGLSISSSSVTRQSSTLTCKNKEMSGSWFIQLKLLLRSI